MFVHSLPKADLVLASNEDFSEVRCYPAFESQDFNVNIYLAQVKEKVSGLKLSLRSADDFTAETSWNLKLSEGETLYKVFYQEGTEGSFQPMAMADTDLLYKYNDKNLFGVLTKEKDSILNVYVINSVTGRVAYKFRESKVDFNSPIAAHYHENKVIVSFSRVNSSKLKQQEISVTELFLTKVENDTIKLLKQAYFNSEEF